ncbi:hypothetical protein C2E25_03035 [Geothermobacter hydrogeniphilus]|uniref:Uncharacterized protein n=1 Tax=Geothermobacter hydrogeniphilus TaxID=1969733 RepID=A0A2K2HDI0_9BACT|nr:hypothetical protein [Geothermobacter hydrogeniphilus]PNU21281.1 hypothetical protein C2E25_03035 [Geothermobacter hydrogeniphilus]
MPDTPSLELQLPKDHLANFFPLFQEGVEVEVEVGHTVRQMLMEQFNISRDYQANRITTIFLNHKAVDDAAAALIEDGATLALSGAMPGLVGATMRSGGHLAAMRDGMTYRNPEQAPATGRGRIRLKLFNLLLPELAPRILLHGILLEPQRLRSLFAEQPESFHTGGRLPTADKRLWENEHLELRVLFGDRNP